MNRPKKPLYRKVNTKAIGVHHKFGKNYKEQRRSKKAYPAKMKKGVKRGLDYTPLFKFLLSKVGEVWNDVHSEAVSRLDKQDPINWMVSSSSKENSTKSFIFGENSYYSRLYVDDNGLLQVVDSNVGPETYYPVCPCCTHTFNGTKFTKKYLSPSEIKEQEEKRPTLHHVG